MDKISVKRDESYLSLIPLTKIKNSNSNNIVIIKNDNHIKNSSNINNNNNESNINSTNNSNNK